jgi:hypothetical protein
MIFSNSRYSGGKRRQVIDNHSINVTTYVIRPKLIPSGYSYFNYIWRDGDRIDTLALNTLGDESLWWEIMDINPDILNPVHIEPGTIVKVPYEK